MRSCPVLEIEQFEFSEQMFDSFHWLRNIINVRISSGEVGLVFQRACVCVMDWTDAMQCLVYLEQI